MAKKAPRSKRVTGPDGGTVVLRKNANGDGSVYWDASGERWRATWRDASGKRRTVTGRTAQEAEERSVVARCGHSHQSTFTGMIFEVSFPNMSMTLTMTL